MNIRRRNFLGLAASGLLTSSLPIAARASEGRALRFGPARRFHFDELIERAQTLAVTPYQFPPAPAPDLVRQIDYEAHGRIGYRRELALWRQGPGTYPVTFFHLGRWFPHPVRIYEIQGDQAREIEYRTEYFDIPADHLAWGLPSSAGFAGFRLHEARQRPDWRVQDWTAFLGASYFRAIGALGQYGLSARGIAINTASPAPEEFPLFREYYLAPAPTPDSPTMVYALLDGPSITGAYRFALFRSQGVVMEVDKHLFLRRDVDRLGIAPLTSMFWFGEYGRGRDLDWRPEVHDSDGMALWTGTGERIWRSLRNPTQAVTSGFLDRNPRGFGLMQRDRNFSHYLDGVFYDRRPSLWIEPKGPWGQGEVQLVELPTDDEIHDNIVAYWKPAAQPRRGATFEFSYRMHWLAEHPYPAESLGRVHSTRMGRGGEAGKERPAGVRKFVVEFAGGELEKLPPGAEPQAVVHASSGRVSLVRTEPVPTTRRWRASFDLALAAGEVSDMRLFLRLDDRALTETWLFQHRAG